MSDKAYTFANGESIDVLRGPNNTVLVGSDKVASKVDADYTKLDSQTKRVQVTNKKGRTLYWVYSQGTKRVVSWPGGSLEIDATNLSDISTSNSGSLKPLKITMPGKVLNIMVNEGQVVSAGQSLAVVEAMKMENILLAPSKAKVSQIKVKAGDRLESGAIIMTFEAAE